MQENRANSYLFGGNAPYVEETVRGLPRQPRLACPTSGARTSTRCRTFPPPTASSARDVAHAPVVESFAQRAKANAFGSQGLAATDLAIARKQVHVQSLIAAYRIARLALGRPRPAEAHRSGRRSPSSSRRSTTSTEADMDIAFSATNTYFTTAENMTLREIVQALRETYCGTIGAEYMHITEPTEKRWWQQRLESIRSKPSFTPRAEDAHPRPPDRGRGPRALPAHQVRRPEALLARRRRELHRLDGRARAARRRQGRAGDRDRHGAPRPPRTCWSTRWARCRKDLFAEFDHTAPEDLPSGDVKYHQGFSSDITTPGGPVHLSLAFNPSHLEIVNPVVEGSVKARLDRRGDTEGDTVLPVHRARRRRLRRPGRRDGDAGAGADARLLHRRHGAHRHQQPDRLHHQRPARLALDAVLHRRRQDDRGAGAARERRRPRGGRAVHASSRSTTARSSTRTSSSTSSASASSATTSRTRRR